MVVTLVCDSRDWLDGQRKTVDNSGGALQDAVKRRAGESGGADLRQ